MKPIKTIICIILSVIVFGSLMPIASGEPGGSVYASQEEQEYIYACSQNELSNVRSLLERYGIRLLKETITPVYTLDMLAFAANDVFEILPAEFSIVSDSRQVYLAKTVSANNDFAGNICFCIEDGVAQLLNLNPSNIIEDYKDNATFQASCSYADHASRIAALLGSDEIIPPENVRFVHLNGYQLSYGDCFYVSIDGEGYFIPVGSISTEYVSAAVDKAITMSELKAMALEDEEKYNEHTIAMEEWRKEHPGSSWVPVHSGSEGDVTIIPGSSVDNIIEVNKFFADQIQPDNTAEPTETPPDNTPLPEEEIGQNDPAATEKTNRYLYWVVPLAVILLAAGIFAAAVSIRKRRKKQ